VPPIFSVEALKWVRKRPTTAGAYAVIVLAFVTAALHFPVALWRLYVEIDALRSKSSVQRELRAADYMGVDTRIFVAARKYIPKDDVYLVVVGRTGPRRDQSELYTVPRFAAWWLLPRRQTRTPSRADWILLYNAKPPAAGVKLKRIIRVGDEIAIAKARR
jgi:hypothetical protein